MLPPTATAQPARADPARVAAQQAFFEAALGKAGGTAGQTAPSAAATVAKLASGAPVATPSGTTRLLEPGAEKPQKILRPGSLLDIRI
jgi:hypothetical protein